MILTLLIPSVLTFALAAEPPATQPAVEYLTDVKHRIVHTQQGWGQMGLNIRAFERGTKREPLKIGDKEYTKGFGHHSPGKIIIDLGAEYERFETEVGLQPLAGGNGSVVFQVFVDDEQRFDSGVMRAADPAKHVSVPVAGAMELRLVVTPADDGILNDFANWADARLIRDASPKQPPSSSMLDAAPFGQVIACDPGRDTGAQSKRIEEYRAEDIFLETELKEQEQGGYTLPQYPTGHCIGLRWFERRPLRELGIEFNGQVPVTEGAQVQCWVGESLWQGNWKPLNGLLDRTETGWRFLVDWAGTPDARDGTRKIRWIIPLSAQIPTPRRLVAITSTPLDTVDLTLQLENPSAGTSARLQIYNGQFEDKERTSITKEWHLAQPLSIQVRYTKPRPWKADSTELRVQLPGRALSVAIDDVIKNGCVYVREAGLFVTTKNGPSLAEFKKQITAQKTILEEVRDLPDQTFAQAMDKVHNPRQNLQPMLLSLPSDNHKFVVYRDGTIDFGNAPIPIGQLPKALKYPTKMTPKFGSGQHQKIRRYLEDAWLPAPVIEVENGGVTYRQRTYVAEIDDPTISPPPPANRGERNPTRPVCVVEFSVVKRESNASDGVIELIFATDAAKGELAKLTLGGNVIGLSVLDGDKVLAVSEGFEAQDATSVQDGRFRLQTKWANQTVLRVYLFTWPETSSRGFCPYVTFDSFRTYWLDLMSRTMQVELPDPLLTNVIRASQVHCLLAARNEENGERISPWIASDAYGPLESESNPIVRAMDVWGHHEFAQRSLDFFINKYSPTGLLTTGYTLMGTGWHLWTLGEHYQLTRDDAWMKSVAPKVANVCEWIIRQRAKTQNEFHLTRPPEYGLVPPGVLADWNAYAYYFCLNGYYYKGLLEAARGLAAIDHDGADKFLKDADAFRDDILRAYHWTQSQMPVFALRDGTSVPGYPSQLTAPGPTNNFFPGDDANRSWCYDVELGAHQFVPQGVLDPKSREVADMMDHMEDVHFLAEGWFDYPAERNQQDPYNLGGFSKVQPYYCRNIEIDALRDDVKPFIRSYFNTIPSLLGLETLSFQEHFNGVAAWNKTHETGYFLYYSRLMLVQERGEDLWLAPFITSNWLKDGAEIKVKNAPTLFGPLSYHIKSAIAHSQIEAEIETPTRSPPQNVVLRLRHPEGKTATIQKVTGVNSDSVTLVKEQIGQESASRVVIAHPNGTTPIHIVVGYSN